MSEQRISPAQFETLQRELMLMESEGYGPEACVIGACNAAGIKSPKPFEPMAVIVDATLASQNNREGQQ
jgi:hypothetical protein